MGSEMCIRDRADGDHAMVAVESAQRAALAIEIVSGEIELVRLPPCLLYTSDAADERSSVDLGGRRIIKKKNSKAISGACMSNINKTNTGSTPRMSQI